MEQVLTERLKQESIQTLGPNNLNFKISDIKNEAQSIELEQTIKITAHYRIGQTRPGPDSRGSFKEFQQVVADYQASANKHQDSDSQIRLQQILTDNPHHFLAHDKCSLVETEYSYSERCSTCKGQGTVTETKVSSRIEFDAQRNEKEVITTTYNDVKCSNCKGHGGIVTDCVIYTQAHRHNSYRSDNNTTTRWFEDYLTKISGRTPDYCKLFQQTKWDRSSYCRSSSSTEGLSFLMNGTIDITQCQTKIDTQRSVQTRFIGPSQLVESLSGLFNATVIAQLKQIKQNNHTIAHSLFTATFGDNIGQNHSSPITDSEYRHVQISSVTAEVAEQTRQSFLTYAKGFKRGKNNQISIFTFLAKTVGWFALVIALLLSLSLLVLYLESTPINYQNIGVELLVQHFDYYFSTFRHIGFNTMLSSAGSGAILGFLLMKTLSSPKTKGKIKFGRWWAVASIIVYFLTVQVTRPVVNSIWADFSLSHWHLSINFACNVFLLSMLIAILRARRGLHLKLQKQLVEIDIPALNKYLGFKSML